MLPYVAENKEVELQNNQNQKRKMMVAGIGIGFPWVLISELQNNIILVQPHGMDGGSQGKTKQSL